MNINKTFITIGIAGALAIGGGTVAMAASGSSPTGDGSGVKAEFVCAHLDEINAQLSGRHQLLEGRLNLLNEARTAAAGHDKVIARIDKRIERTNTAISKNDERTAKLAAWAPEHCPAATPAG